MSYRGKSGRAHKRPAHVVSLDVRLMPPHQRVIKGTYRGQKTPTFVPQKGGETVTRTVEAKNGWYRALVLLDGAVWYKSKGFRSRAAAWADIASGLQLVG